MKALILLTFIGMICFTATGQSRRLKKADDYYNHLSYAYAIPLYENLIGSEADNTAMRSRLAKSYYHIGDMAKAEEQYAQVVQRSDASKEDLYFYSQTLKQNGKYAESDQWMQKFNQLNGSDLRAESYADQPDYRQKILQQEAHFAIKSLDINTASSDFGGYPAIDQQTYYFVSARRKRVFVQNQWSWTSNRFLDLYKASHQSDQELTDPELLSRKVNTKYHEGPLCYAPDGKTVYFTRNNIAKGKNKRDKKGIQNLELYRADIAADGKWINEEVLIFNSRDYSVGHPSISADGKTLYFASDMPGGFGGSDLYKVVINGDGTFGPPINLGKEFNTEGQEMFPWIASDGNLFFASDGLIGLGGLDIFVGIANKTGAFGKVENVGLPVNGQNDDFAFVLSADNTTGYFSSNREGGKGDDDIYAFTLKKPFTRQLIVEGIVADSRSGEILPGATVELKDPAGNVIASAVADEKGKYSFALEPDNDYTVSSSNPDYFDNTISLSSRNLDPKVEVIEQNVPLEKDPGLALYAWVTDANTDTPLESVSLKITDNMTGEIFIQTITPASGDAMKGIAGKKIGDRVSYNIEMRKDGYFPKTVTFNYEVKEPGVIKIHEVMEGALEMDKEVADLRDMVKISPIKFDYNKSNIRPDAAVELDKIVEIMNRYPNMVIELGSHTDCRGSVGYNQKLSDQRAKSSAAYIKSKIVNPDRIYGKGYGESKLLNGCSCEGKVKSNCSEEEHQKNRRTEFKVISTGADVDVINTSPDSFDN